MGEVWYHDAGREHHHQVAHGLSCAEFDALATRAAGRCELCGTLTAETGGKRTIIDHYEQHPDIYFVRGMICDRCNSMMSGADGNRVWYPHRGDMDRVRSYLAASWQQPTADEICRIEIYIAEHWRPGRAMAVSMLAAYRPTTLF